MEIEELRARIDALDAQIVQLLCTRAELARQIGQIKAQQNAIAYAPAREKEVVRRVLKLAKPPLSKEALQAIYTEIISACRSVEGRTRVAFLGPAGTFSQQAARKKFGSSVDFIPANGISGVFAQVERGDADFGVVPIETLADGSISETLEMFIQTSLKVCGEIHLRIHQNLMAACKREEVRRIYSKAQAFSQCKTWLADNFPGVELRETSSTTEAARLASSEPGAAAIAHQEAAKLYGLQILARNIEDSPYNVTRFLVIGKESCGPTGRDKTSLLCFIKDEVGALFHLLQSFWKQGINLTYIQSFPSRRKAWDYCFFIDLAGHSSDKPVAEALVEVARRCKELKLLGSYPVAEE